MVIPDAPDDDRDRDHGPGTGSVHARSGGGGALSAPTGEEPALRAVPRADGTPPRALVLGATGYIGGRLVPRLLAAGYRVRVLVREPARLAAFSWAADVEVVAGPAEDATAVAEA
ncbi:MAG: NAD-dependent epimerase/dehydratase family protein, partial [Microbacterium sp.]